MLLQISAHNMRLLSIEGRASIRHPELLNKSIGQTWIDGLLTRLIQQNQPALISYREKAFYSHSYDNL